jgi:hypothetical protein
VTSTSSSGSSQFGGRSPQQPPPTAEREVRVRLNVYNITEVNLPQHTFTLDFFVEVTWEDEDLTNGEELSHDLDIDDWESMFPYTPRLGMLNWSPRLVFQNIKKLEDKKSWIKVYTMRDDGVNPLPFPVVCFSTLVSGGTFFERFELLQFPFDAQDLQISIMALHHLKTQDELSMAGRRRSVGEERVLQTRPSGLASGGSGGLTGPWWTVDASSDRRAQCFGTPGRYGPPGAPHLIKNENVKYKPVVPFDTFVLQDEYVLVNGVFALEKLSDARTSATRMRYPLLVLSLKIVRRAQVYIQNVVLPTFLFVVLGFMSFAFKPDDLSDRLSLVTSLLLTAVTYQQFVSEQLPKTIDTELHRYVQTAIFVLFVVGIEAVALNKLNEWVSSASSDAAVEERAQLIAYNEDGAAFVVLCVWIAKHFRYLGYLLNVVGPEDGYSGDVPKTQLQTEVEAEIELLKAVLENYTNNDEQQENNVARYRQSLRIYERWVKDMSEFQQKSDEKQAANAGGTTPASSGGGGDAITPGQILYRSDSLGSAFDTDRLYNRVAGEAAQKRSRERQRRQRRNRVVLLAVAALLVGAFVGVVILRQQRQKRTPLRDGGGRGEL